MNANIYRLKKNILHTKSLCSLRRSSLRARNLLLIKAFIEEIYNRFIVYLFLLIWCFMCGRNFELFYRMVFIELAAVLVPSLEIRAKKVSYVRGGFKSYDAFSISSPMSRNIFLAF